MNLPQRIERWGDNHHPKWIDGLRILLGLLLMWKGIQFVNNIDLLKARIAEQPFPDGAFFLAGSLHSFRAYRGRVVHRPGPAYPCWQVIANLPVPIGAVFFVSAGTGLFSVYPELSLSIAVLLMLPFFLVEGSGRISVDEYMRRHPEPDNYPAGMK